MDTLGGNQEMTVISEPGLYSLILRSRKPEAKAFKRWVTHEVLPSIRRHGMYATESVVDAMLADPEAMIRTLTALKEERAKRAQLEKQAQANAPKVVFADAVASAQTDILIGDLAKILRGNGVDTRSAPPVRVSARKRLPHPTERLVVEHAHQKGNGHGAVQGEGICCHSRRRAYNG